MADNSRTKFYLNRQDRKWKGVCAGIADYTGIEVLWVRIAMILLTLAGGFPWTLIAYMLIGWMAEDRPANLYGSPEDAKFWQGVRSNPKRTTAEVRSMGMKVAASPTGAWRDSTLNRACSSTASSAQHRAK